MMSVIIRILITSIIATLLLQSCGGLEDNEFIDADEQARLDDAEIADYLAVNNIVAEKDEETGIYIRKDVTTNSSESGSGRICGIYYTISLLGGEPFDSHTEEDGESLLLRQGANAVRPFGLDFGVGQMSRDETYTFYIPSQSAYGFLSFSDIIPQGAIIEMTVTLDRVYSETDLLSLESNQIDEFIEENNLNDTDENPEEPVETLPSGVRFKLLARGQGGQSPQSKQIVGVKYIGSFLDGQIFDQTRDDNLFTYKYDSAVVIPGFDEGVGNLELGDKGLVIIPSNSAYAESVRVIPAFMKSQFIINRVIPGYVGTIDPYSILLFEIELNEIQ